MARAGTPEEKEEVVMGRRGCRASGKAGILSGWVCTLHGMGTAGKGHGSAVTQWDVREGGWKGQFPYKPEAGEGKREKRQAQGSEKEDFFFSHLNLLIIIIII